MTRIKLVLVAAALAVVALGGTGTAQSSTCAIADPTLDHVVCGVVFGSVAPALAPLCEKYDLCLA